MIAMRSVFTAVGLVLFALGGGEARLSAREEPSTQDRDERFSELVKSVFRLA